MERTAVEHPYPLHDQQRGLALMAQPADIPSFDVDPFSTAYFDDPYPVQEQLREAGPVVWLSRYDICAVARYEQVRATLLDWRTFSSARGVAWATLPKRHRGARRASCWKQIRRCTIAPAGF